MKPKILQSQTSIKLRVGFRIVNSAFCFLVVSSQFQDILPMNNVSSLVCASTAKALTSKAFAASAIKGGYNAYTFESSTGKCNIGRMPPYIYYNSDPLQEQDENHLRPAEILDMRTFLKSQRYLFKDDCHDLPAIAQNREKIQS